MAGRDRKSTSLRSRHQRWRWLAMKSGRIETDPVYRRQRAQNRRHSAPLAYSELPRQLTGTVTVTDTRTERIPYRARWSLKRLDDDNAVPPHGAIRLNVGTESRDLSDHAESVAERIAAKRGGWPAAALEFLLAFRAGAQRPFQKGIEIIDVKIDMDRCPVTLVPAHAIGTQRRFATSRLLNDPDPGVAALEDHISRDGPCDFAQRQSVAIKTQPLIDLGNVDGNRVLHVVPSRFRGTYSSAPAQSFISSSIDDP
jgi:hypothetical protein